MEDKPTIKKAIQFRDIEIRLMDVEQPNKVPYENVANIIAVDSTGRTVWIVEPPVTHYEYYYSMGIEESKNLLIATTGGGYKHLINLDNGKIIDAYLVK